MNISLQDHLLACLIEECAEIQKRATKSIRFGIDDRDPTRKRSLPERKRLIHELSDLAGVVELLRKFEIIDCDPFKDRVAIEAKKEKIHKYLGYARKKGRL